MSSGNQSEVLRWAILLPRPLQPRPPWQTMIYPCCSGRRTKRPFAPRSVSSICCARNWFSCTLAGLFSFLPFKVGPLTISGVHIPALPVADLVAAVFILIALIMRLIRFFRHPDTLWYEARAVAEI